MVRRQINYIKSGGTPTNKRCIQTEVPDQWVWADNYLCVPHSSPYRFEWSHQGRIPGKDCIQIMDYLQKQGDVLPHPWDDNYLCAFAGKT